MKQRNEIDIHNEFCRAVQNAKEEYYREVYDAPELDINKLVKSNRKRTIKRIGQIAAIFLLFVISSVFFAQEFLSDNGYGKYIVQKSVSSMSPLDIKTERLGNGETFSSVYINGELVKILDNGDKIYGERLDKGTYTVTRIINDYIFIVIDGDGDYNEAIKVAENAEVK